MDEIAHGRDAEPSTRVAVREPPPRLDVTLMPADFSISLDEYRRGGTDAFLAHRPDHLRRQPLRGFEDRFVNIIDCIVRITHQIWEQDDIGYIYDTYAHDANVWDDYGLQTGATRSSPTSCTRPMPSPIFA